LLIVYEKAFASRLDLGMPSGDGVVVQFDVAIFAATEDEGSFPQRIPAPHIGSGWINMNKARLAIGC
jgi:hypothetical protein